MEESEEMDDKEEVERSRQIRSNEALSAQTQMINSFSAYTSWGNVAEAEEDDFYADRLLERFELHAIDHSVADQIPTPPPTPLQSPLDQTENSVNPGINGDQQADEASTASVHEEWNGNSSETLHGAQPVPALTLTAAPATSSSPIRALTQLGAGRGVIVHGRREPQTGGQAEYSITVIDTPWMRDADSELTQWHLPNGVEDHEVDESDYPAGQDADWVYLSS
ncbi:hypothetical protein PV08_07142 [Exophiala spinifera]|uniref:Uncharacterized protein n=1 Tax=Exophiala spinifera TaxID=91928 RepID=A0A0D2B6Q1_9EURO|nr:uncharacterized protein PV08_07142 [Exophiala spinifera]KIW14360.1 hypothetical protein PV08_07142 [Exophiala spinifera]